MKQLKSFKKYIFVYFTVGMDLIDYGESVNHGPESLESILKAP